MIQMEFRGFDSIVHDTSDISVLFKPNNISIKTHNQEESVFDWQSIKTNEDLLHLLCIVINDDFHFCRYR